MIRVEFVLFCNFENLMLYHSNLRAFTFKKDFKADFAWKEVASARSKKSSGNLKNSNLNLRKKMVEN